MAVLRRGRRNNPEAVRALQNVLKTAGLYTGEVDGKFGRGTEAAVKAFQERAGLTVDGAVGPLTFNALNTMSGQPRVANIPVPRPRPERRYSDETLAADAAALASASAGAGGSGSGTQGRKAPTGAAGGNVPGPGLADSPEARPSLLAAGHLPANAKWEPIPDYPVSQRLAPNDYRLRTDNPARRDPDSRMGSPRQLEVNAGLDLADDFIEARRRQFGTEPRPGRQDYFESTSRMRWIGNDTGPDKFDIANVVPGEQMPGLQERARASRARRAEQQRLEGLAAASRRKPSLLENANGEIIDSATGKPVDVIWLDGIRQEISPPVRPQPETTAQPEATPGPPPDDAAIIEMFRQGAEESKVLELLLQRPGYSEERARRHMANLKRISSGGTRESSREREIEESQRTIERLRAERARRRAEHEQLMQELRDDRRRRETQEQRRD